MTIQQSKADTAPATDVKAAARQPAEVTPQFRALGIPALAAATRSAPKRPAENKRELPHFLRQPHYS